MVKKLDQVVAGDNAGGDDIGEGGHLGGRRGEGRGEQKVMGGASGARRWKFCG